MDDFYSKNDENASVSSDSDEEIEAYDEHNAQRKKLNARSNKAQIRNSLSDISSIMQNFLNEIQKARENAHKAASSDGLKKEIAEAHSMAVKLLNIIVAMTSDSVNTAIPADGTKYRFLFIKVYF